MTTRKLARAEWQDYFDGLSHHLPATEVEIEVASLDIGDQIQVEWVPLSGITYDPHDDALEVAAESLHHAIGKPQEVHVFETGMGLQAVHVIDGDGRLQIIQLRAPLRLGVG